MSATGQALSVRVVAVSHRGVAREANEDALGFAGWTLTGAEGTPLVVTIPLAETITLVVADGLGGHLGGAEASRFAVESILGPGAGVSGDDVGARITEASEQIFRRGDGDAALRGMAATIAGLRIDPAGNALVFNVGDSRVYRVADGYLGLVSVDDRPVNPSPGDTGVVTQVLGGFQRTAVEVHEVSLLLGEGDRLLLCTDGLSDVLDEEVLGELLVSDAVAAGRGLLGAALAAGAPDNVTFLIVDLGGTDSG